MAVKLRATEIRRRIRKIHKGLRYKYINWKDATTSTKNTLICICPKHGQFSYSIGSIIRDKFICPVCSRFRPIRKYRNFSDVKTILDKVFPSYTYKERTYKNWCSKMKVICPKHGEFLASPRELNRRHGCPKCAIENRRNALINNKTWLNKKKVQININKKSFTLDSKEEKFVLSKLLKYFNEKEISTDTPKIEFTYKKKKHVHIPDFYIKKENLILEVKSIGTLGLGSFRLGPKSSRINPLTVCKYKAIAAIKQGYNYRVVVSSYRNSIAVVLRQNWYNLSCAEIKKIINKFAKKKLV